MWTWLPADSDPVVAGVVEVRGTRDPVLSFAYGRSYLDRENAAPIYLPELPLRRGRQMPGEHLAGAEPLTCHGVIRDAAPDAWGQRVIMRRLLGRADTARDLGELPLLTYLLESGSDRPGALDFQLSERHYVGRYSAASVGELLEAARRIESGDPIPEELADALLGGSSLGGARPKATVVADDGTAKIAKFPRDNDVYPVVAAEAVAMDLAGRVGIDVATTELVEVGGRRVLLVDRFDRPGDGLRRQFVSALTVLGLDENFARYATYHDLAEHLRHRSPDRALALRELFSRIVFNVLVSNTDDHARNHALFCRGDELTLTPAYDICPQARAGRTQEQVMAIDRTGAKSAQLSTCVAAAAVYELSESEARAIVSHQVDVIRVEWADAADRARLTAAERSALWGRQFLNPYAFDDYQ